MRGMGYPHYVLSLIGVGKIAGAIVIAIPSLDRLKEWAFAGFSIDFVGAIASHVISGDTFEQTAPAVMAALFLGAAYFVWKRHGPLVEAEPAAISQDILDKLRSLGYVN